MKVSRREFVSTASCAAAASLCALPSSVFAANASPVNIGTGCMVVNLESNCTLPESLAGMQAALGDLHDSVSEGEFASRDLVSRSGVSRKLTSNIALPRTRARIVIVPAAGAVRPATCSAVAELVDGGATVIWESGAAFLHPADFAEQQALMQKHFAILIGEPVHLWQQSSGRKSKFAAPFQSPRGMRAIGHEQIPYVAYRWPLKGHVRDFSRIVPVSATSGHAIAHLNEVPVAWRKNIGAGTLIFLGSPLGPALRAGDGEACALLQSITAL